MSKDLVVTVELPIDVFTLVELFDFLKCKGDVLLVEVGLCIGIV